MADSVHLLHKKSWRPMYQPAAMMMDPFGVYLPYFSATFLKLCSFSP